MIASPRLRLGSCALLLVACGGEDPSTTDASTTAGPTTTPTTSDATASTTDDATSAGTTGDSSQTTVAPTTTETETEATTTETETEATTDPLTESESETEATTDQFCPMGQIVCEDGIAKVCDGMGGYSEETPCDEACADGLGCVLCVPGEGTCDGELATVCNDDGDGYDEYTCDPIQGVTCDPQQGKCVGACAPDNIKNSYIGCDYYPTVTPNVVGTEYDFAVTVSNTAGSDAMITITRGPNMVYDTVVPAGSVEVIPLPWVNELKSTGMSRVVVDGAYRLRSDRPITVYQYNPLQYTKNGNFSFTNDASLLLPVNAWRDDYVVAVRNTLNGLPGVYAVVAREDGTTVTPEPSASGGIVVAGAGIAADGTGMVTIDEGDVLLVLSGVGGGGPDVADLTGTRVKTSAPVQVISAHACTYVPYDVFACDHLEESNLPYENIASQYIVTTPLVKPPMQAPQLKGRMVRVIATEAATTISYEPPQMGAPTMLANAGDYFELDSIDTDFMITADHKIVVAEYMLGQDAGGNTGDPAMTIAVPLDQYRDNYLFHAAISYESSFVNIIAKDGASVTLDDAPVAGFTVIGATGYAVARVEMSNAGDGTHKITGDQPFGIQVYGYGQYTSYWYPGGSDLKPILE